VKDVLWVSGPGWRTNDEYVDSLKLMLPEQSRLIKRGGKFLVRPPAGVAKQVRTLVEAAGFTYVKTLPITKSTLCECGCGDVRLWQQYRRKD
jgi:hypothetical protein